jgi:hypothetical protein
LTVICRESNRSIKHTDNQEEATNELEMSTETTNGKTASPSSNNNNNTPTSSSSESSPGGASLAFNERNFSAKLDAVAPTQDSIQSLGLWILHHKFHHEAICRIWLDKLTDC